jgi:hypothetical protein
MRRQAVEEEVQRLGAPADPDIDRAGGESPPEARVAQSGSDGGPSRALHTLPMTTDRIVVPQAHKQTRM